MKRFINAILGAFALALLSNAPVFAIENLQIFEAGSNVLLSWPSLETETYIVQYRQSLTDTNGWQTLASGWPADAGTNLTFFTHSNAVQYPVGGGGSYMAMASGESQLSLASSSTAIHPPAPLAIPINGSGAAVPLALYPPGLDMSGFLIYDPVTDMTFSSAEYAANASGSLRVMDTELDGGFFPVPMGGASGTQPEPETGFYRVVRNGAHLYGVTNDTVFSGVVTIPVEVANDAGDLMSLSLTENDTPLGAASIVSAPFTGLMGLVMDTTLMNNGIHQIVASARWEDTNGGLWEADSPALEIIVTNEVSFPNWMSRFGELGDSLFFAAQAANPPVNWEVFAFDSQSNYVTSFTGYSEDGVIEFPWDLSDTNGVIHTNNNFFLFTIAVTHTNQSLMRANGVQPQAHQPPPNYPNPPAHPTPPINWANDRWPYPGQWVIAVQHAFDGIYDHNTLYNEMDGYVYGANYLGYSVWPPPDIDGHAFGMHFAAVGDAQQNADWANLRLGLFYPTERNFVYFGHGGPNGIGYRSRDTNAFISATEIANKLHTIPNNQTNRHAYRFVFVDACSTAKGTMPESFGVIHKENVPLNNYTQAQIRPSCYVGWTADKYIGLFGSYLFYDHVNFIEWTEYYLATGDGIQRAITRAAALPQSGWVWTSQFKVYGYADQQFDSWNQANP